MKEIRICPVCDEELRKGVHGNQKYCSVHTSKKVRQGVEGWCGKCRAKPSLNDSVFCEDCLEYYREYKRERYRNDPEFREYHREYWRERYRNDPEFREKQLEYQREKYHNDPEYREKKLEYEREKYQLVKERQECLLNNPDELEKIRKKIMKEVGE